MKAMLLVTAGALLLMAGNGSSLLPCNGNVTDVGGVLYIDDRGADPSEGNLWVYLESNGAAGLQSGGNGPLNGVAGIIHVDSCHNNSHDTLLY